MIQKRKSNTNMSTIMNSYTIVETIDDTFCYIYYGKLILIIMKESGYINATKICLIKGKEFHRWQRLDTSKDLISLVERNISPYKPIISISNECKYPLKYDVSGSYVHPTLFPHILLWLSTRYALQISKVINLLCSNMYYIKKI